MKNDDDISLQEDSEKYDEDNNDNLSISEKMDNNKGNNDVTNEIMEDVMNMIENGNDSSSADDSSDIEVMSMSSNSSKNQQTLTKKTNTRNTVSSNKTKFKKAQQPTDKNNYKYNCRIYNSTDLKVLSSYK